MYLWDLTKENIFKTLSVKFEISSLSVKFILKSIIFIYKNQHHIVPR